MEGFPPWFTATFSIMGAILSLTGVITLIVKFVTNPNLHDFLLSFVQKKASIQLKDYFSTAFLVRHIKNAKKTVTIFSVKNSRVAVPDVVESIQSFCMKGGECTIMTLSPNVSDDIISKIMQTLPTAPSDVVEYKNELRVNKQKYKNMHDGLGVNSKTKLTYYEYSVLPTMHFCQFDNKIYLGFQVFENKNDALQAFNLLDACMVVKTNSKLGQMIMHQIVYLKSTIGDNENAKLCKYI